MVICTGNELKWDDIKGAKECLDDPNYPVGSIYSLNYAIKTARLARALMKGNAIFTEPVGPIKVTFHF